MMFQPLAILHADGQFYSFDVFGVSTIAPQSELIYPIWGLFVIVALIALLSLFTIFLYKKRILQIRICIFNAVLMLGFYAFFGYMAYQINQQIPNLDFTVRIVLAFPLISLILDYLAIRNIGADETLVRSLERLR